MKVNVKDVSQSTDIYEIAEVIQALNPNVQIRVGDMNLDPLATRRIYSSVPLDRLVLPEGYYTDDKDITNRHRTKTGLYCSIRVDDLALADESTLKPKIKEISQTTNIDEIRDALQELNPNAEIRVTDLVLSPSLDRKIYSSVPLDELVLPDGFYIDDRDITNRHRTRTGLYCSIQVEDLALADRRYLKPKYDVTKTTNISEIAEVLQELNPDAEIRLGDARVDSQAARRLYSSLPLEDLVLPYGLYMHDENTLTNKHKTENGIYCLLRVEDLALADESKLMPRVHRIISRDVPTTNDQKQTVKQIVLGAIIRLLNRAIDKVSDMYVKTR